MVLAEQQFAVLIESDWNLKQIGRLIIFWLPGSINRIRLEFKAMNGNNYITDDVGINRIRLEFKGV